MVSNYFYLYQYPRLRRPASSAPAVADNASLFSFRTQATATPPLPTSPTPHHQQHPHHHHHHHQPVEGTHSHPHHHNHSRLSPPSLSRPHFPPPRRPSHPLLEFAFTRIFPAMSQTLHLIPASPPTPLAAVSSPRSATTPTAPTSSSCVTPSSPSASILHIPQLSMAIGTHEHANPRYRRRMEDRSVCTPLRRAGGVFLAVYDGHGGCEAARLVSEKLHRHFETSLESTSSSCVDTAGVRVSSLAPAELIRNAFLHAYSQTDRELRQARAFNVGAVAVTVYVTRNAAGARRMYVANAGDARVVLCRARRAERLTVDHRPNLITERSRVLANGGFIAAGRVNGVLAVSRALGDHGMKSVVIAQPDFKEVLLRECDEFVIIACDGLWDVIDDSAAVRIAQDACDRGLSPNAIAKVLVDAAIAAGSTDNVSVIFASLDCD